MKKSYDVVVIGSGFGGAITACRLAQAGRSVCILEKGRRWKVTDFPRSIAQQAKHAWWRDNESFGLIELVLCEKMDVLQGVGVGGGSLHYYNVHIRADTDIFEMPAWPKKITRELLDPYYDVAKDMLDAQPLKPPAGREMPPKTVAFMEAAKKAGAKDVRLEDIAIYTGEGRTNPHGKKDYQHPHDFTCSDMLGNRAGAKNTLDKNYIPIAEANGAEVYPLHEVAKIEQTAGGNYRVHFKVLNMNHPGTSEPGTVEGKQVVLGAGTLGTIEILLRSRNKYATLPDISPTLGHRFSGNGDYILSGTANCAMEIDASYGAPITAGADFSTKNHKLRIQDLGYPESWIWYIEGMLDDRHEGDFDLSNLTHGDFMMKYLPYLGMGVDAADGQIKLNDEGKAEVLWSHEKSEAMFEEMRDALKRLSTALGGQYVDSLLWSSPLRKLVTAHPLGGAVLSESEAQGVVNEVGEVWNYPGLYVADASIIPTAVAVNPTATISALAERIAFHMVHGREMKPGDKDTPKNTV